MVQQCSAMGMNYVQLHAQYNLYFYVHIDSIYVYN